MLETILAPLFAPYRIGKLELPNRWVMAPMTRKRSPGGVPTATVAEYYRRRAAGGVGLIVTEGTLVDHPLASPDDDIPRIAADTVPAWQDVVTAVHQQKSKIFVQLWHQGPMARPGIAAIAMSEDGREVVAQAGPDDEQALAEAFVQGAVYAQQIGFDGLELHGAHGYLLDSFIRHGRLPWICDLVRQMRRRVGPDFPLAIRFSQWRVGAFEDRQFDSPQDLEQTVLALKEAGIDLFHASSRRFWLPEFAGSDLNLAGWTRKFTGSPTITVGNVGLVSAEFAGVGLSGAGELLRRYGRGDFDMVALGRPLLSDAAWCAKMHQGQSAEIVDYSPAANQIYP